MAEETSIPCATKWLIDSLGETGRKSINFVLMIINQKNDSKGTGFLYKNRYVITNYHIIDGCLPGEVVAVDNKGQSMAIKDITYDINRDLALLTLINPRNGGLKIIKDTEIKPGVKISTWGYPLGYNGPTPLLSVGYVAGFNDHRNSPNSPIVKHIVVNGAFNPGNSGGPLFISGSNQVIGVVVSKHAPLTHFVASAIKVLSENKTGVCFTGTDRQGNTINFVESQIVAEILKYYRDLTQVMIGEAIDISEVIKFLSDNNLKIDAIK